MPTGSLKVKCLAVLYDSINDLFVLYQKTYLLHQIFILKYFVCQCYDVYVGNYLFGLLQDCKWLYTVV